MHRNFTSLTVITWLLIRGPINSYMGKAVSLAERKNGRKIYRKVRKTKSDGRNKVIRKKKIKINK